MVTENPWVTDLFPPFARVKLKAIGAVTFTVTDWLVVPPVPVQESVKVELAVRLPVDWEPEVDFAPDQTLEVGDPDAVHEVALVDDHERVEAVPEVIEVGLAERETVGVTVPPVLHSDGIAPNICSTNWVTEFPAPPNIVSGFLPLADNAALILASIGHGQSGEEVRTPLTY